MRLPHDWDARRAPGYGEVHYLTHTSCGWRTPFPVDTLNEREMRKTVFGHACATRSHYDNDAQQRINDLEEQVRELRDRLGIDIDDAD